MRASVGVLVGMLAFPAWAEDQASLAARIIALSITRDIDTFSPDERKTLNLEIADASPVIWAQSRMLLDKCRMTLETATIALGFDYPITVMTPDLRDSSISFEAVFPVGEKEFNLIGLTYGQTPRPAAFIALDQTDTANTTIAKIKAQVFETTTVEKLTHAMDFPFGTPDPTGDLLRDLGNCRTAYCVAHS